MADHQLSDLGLNYNLREENLYEFNNSLKFAYEFENFYTWTNKCDEFYNIDINKVWDEIFELSDLIVYQRTRGANNDSITDHNNGESTTPKTFGQIEFNEIENMVETGYVIPKYEFLDLKLNGGLYDHIEYEPVFYKFKKLYEDAVDLFDLNKEGKVSIKNYIQIGKLRDMLFGQLERQANLVQNVHSEIADILKVYYYETERAIVKAKKNANSKIIIDRIDEDWRIIRQELKALFQFKIRKGLSLEKIKWHDESIKLKNKQMTEQFGLTYSDFEPIQLDNDKYVSKDILEYIIAGYEVHMKYKESIIDTSMVLFEQIAPLESILEDFFMGRKIKSAEEFRISLTRDLVNKYQGEKYWETAHDYYHNSDLIWEDVYKKMVKEMKAAGLEVRHTTYDSFISNKSKHDKKKNR